MTSIASALKRRLVVKGTQENPFLDNDDIRPLSLEDRTWTQTTYFTFWFSAAATGTSLSFLICFRCLYQQYDPLIRTLFDKSL